MLTYNLSLIYLSAFFFVDLFVGVVFLNYVLAEDKIKNNYITEDQQRWVDLNRKIIAVEPDYKLFKPITNAFQKRLDYYLTYKNIFENFILLIILFNIVFMCTTYESEPLYEK